MGSRKAFLIDGTAFCYRAFHALPDLSTADGRPTNAVYGFAVMLQALREKEHPAYLAVAFDVGKPTFRHQRYQDYKIHRQPMPEGLVAQLPTIKALLGVYRVPIFEMAGYEAEDVLATLAKQLVGAGAEVLVVTGDKDALQLVNSHIKVYNPHKEEAVLDAKAVEARYGVGPEQMVDLLALMGDETDHIPGVRGIGEKTAAKLLQRFGTLEAVYARLHDVQSAAQRARLEAGRADAQLSRELAQIDRDVPVRVALDEIAVQEPDWKALRAMFRDLGFRRLLTEVERQGPAAHPQAITLRQAATKEALKELTAALRAAQGPVALLGVVGGHPLKMLLAVAWEAQSAWIVELDTARLKDTGGSGFLDWLQDPRAPKLGHDVKTLARQLDRLGVALEGIAGDTLLAAYLVNPARTNQRLADLADEYLDEPLPALPEAEALEDLGSAEAQQTLGLQAGAVVKLHERLSARLREHALESLYRELELPLAAVLADMERRGIAVDLNELAALRASMDAQLTRLTEELYRLAGTTFNLNSPKQLAQVLYERLQLPILKRTKTGPSTDADVLRQLAAQHPLPARLTEYRELTKLVSTYVEALPKLVDPATGRLHTSFNQAATATGRLSSSDPNLQNIPIKTELGRKIRKAFVPGERGWVLVALDYSQIELRILAHLSKDPTLCEAFAQDRDVHRFTASLIYGVPEAEVQPEQRQAMKAINYGIVYGMSAHGLAKELAIPHEEAHAFIEAYFARYPLVRRYLDEQIAQARRLGYVQTVLGRRRYIPELASADPVMRQFGERIAVNAPIQGSAADVIKRAMLEVWSQVRAKRLASRMLLQVHDELLFEAPREEQSALVALVRPIMEGVMPLDVALTVTVKAGPNWLQLAPLSS